MRFILATRNYTCTTEWADVHVYVRVCFMCITNNRRTYASAHALYRTVQVRNTHSIGEVEEVVVCLLLCHGAVLEAGVRHVTLLATAAVIATVCTE